MLKGQTAPQTVIKSEQPWHRAALYMKAWGKTNREISSATGKHYQHVCILVRQPWFVAELVKLLHAKGSNGLEEMIRVMASDAAQIAYETMLSTKDENLRAQCAFQMMKQSMGTKLVHEDQTRPAEVVKEDIERLEAEIKELEGARNADAFSAVQRSGTQNLIDERSTHRSIDDEKVEKDSNDVPLLAETALVRTEPTDNGNSDSSS